MATVASGGADSYYEQGIHAWDVCAGEIIVKEAGGAVIDFSGKLYSFHLNLTNING